MTKVGSKLRNKRAAMGTALTEEAAAAAAAVAAANRKKNILSCF